MKINIELSDDNFGGKYPNAAKIVIDNNGVKSSKMVSMENLRNLINDNCYYEKPEGFTRIGVLPNGLYDASIKEEDGIFNAYATIITPQKKQMITFIDQGFYILFPSLIYFFKVEANRCVKSSVFAIKDKVPMDHSKLFNYPFGNVHNDGKICWGNIQLPEINSLFDLQEIVKLFIQSPTNLDLYHNPSFNNPREMYKKLEHCRVFPAKLLTEIKNETVGQKFNRRG